MKKSNMKRIIPTAVLSTAILLSPVQVFASEQYAGQKASITTAQKNAGMKSSDVVNKEVIKRDIAERLKNYVTEGIPEGDLRSKMRNQMDRLVNNWTPQYENTVNNISVDNVNIDSYKDDNLELGSLRNGGSTPQTLKIPGTTKKTTSSFTYSNQEGVKIGGGADAKVSVGVPFIGEGGATVKSSFEFSFTHTSSNTDTTETTVTYPEQTISCPAKTLCSMSIKTSQANFSGIMGVDQKLANFDKIADRKLFLRYPLNLHELYERTSSKIPLPAGVTLNDNDVIFKTGVPFNGVAGHLTAAEYTEVKLESMDGKKKVVMPLRLYQIPQKRAEVLKQKGF
ncbi:ETX/MTX2 family pore-forming toxin [Baia soyae]|uniref:Toxin ETX/toxin MTX2 n=1 Tax=Baia soyae TaxID=1544746 RepID=A0A4R2RXT0_9BACL|nr:ETX/MTX2 family pore-forming toxin [Baia soyae]TCP63925.1 toxin ETX/toxin MTX2 [Baia soyae]